MLNSKYITIVTKKIREYSGKVPFLESCKFFVVSFFVNINAYTLLSKVKQPLFFEKKGAVLLLKHYQSKKDIKIQVRRSALLFQYYKKVEQDKEFFVV